MDAGLSLDYTHLPAISIMGGVVFAGIPGIFAASRLR